jgi:hypothetical protein
VVALHVHAGGTQLRTAALHNLALVAGSDREDVEMSAAAEDALRRTVYESAGMSPPAEVLLGSLRQPFAELRCGAYRHVRPFSPITTVPLILTLISVSGVVVGSLCYMLRLAEMTGMHKSV